MISRQRGPVGAHELLKHVSLERFKSLLYSNLHTYVLSKI